MNTNSTTSKPIALVAFGFAAVSAVMMAGCSNNDQAVAFNLFRLFSPPPPQQPQTLDLTAQEKVDLVHEVQTDPTRLESLTVRERRFLAGALLHAEEADER